MNGADLLIRTAIALGVEVCFANPGTTEMPMVVALDNTPGIRAFLGLFEGVCTGAADGYGRMLGKPAMTLLHLGPGFANGIANLHNARRARSPVLNVIGEHATWHRDTDPPLAMDIKSLVRTVSGWWREVPSPAGVSEETANAVAAAQAGQVATLIFPHDHQLGEGGNRLAGAREIPYTPLDPASIEAIASRLRKAERIALLIGGRGLRRQGLMAAARIQKAIPCDLFAPTLPGAIDRGAGLPPVARIPYFPEQAVAKLSRYEVVLLAGAREPVTFFGYPGVRSRILSEEQKTMTLCTESQDVVKALDLLADALVTPTGFAGQSASSPEIQRPPIPTGDLTPEKVCLTLAALQPEHAIVVDESVTTGSSYFSLSAGLPPHTLLTLSGGSIGYGIPCATGAAIACPERPVINHQADGSALYTVQALWTQAKEGLNVTTLICSNRSYRILQVELQRAGIALQGSNAQALTELSNPEVDWVKIAQGFGVPGARVASVEDLAYEIGKALAEPGPHLIEMLLP